MKIEDIFKPFTIILARAVNHPEEADKELEELVKNFNENYKIVPKNEFGVIYNSNDAGRVVVGGFHSESEAKRFRDEWYRKEEEYIESILATNPESNICSNTYLTVGKIDPIKDKYREWWKFDSELKEEEDAANKPK